MTDEDKQKLMRDDAFYRRRKNMLPLPWLGYIKRDVVRGRHSGFPECCIGFYVRVWQPLFISEDESVQDMMEEYRERLDELKAWYVLCPNCIADKKMTPTWSHTCEKCDF